MIKPSPIMRSLYENHIASVAFKIWNRDIIIYRIIYRKCKKVMKNGKTYYLFKMVLNQKKSDNFVYEREIREGNPLII